jgi:hypothetical protein
LRNSCRLGSTFLPAAAAAASAASASAPRAAAAAAAAAAGGSLLLEHGLASWLLLLLHLQSALREQQRPKHIPPTSGMLCGTPINLGPTFPVHRHLPLLRHLPGAKLPPPSRQRGLQDGSNVRLDSRTCLMVVDNGSCQGLARSLAVTSLTFGSCSVDLLAVTRALAAHMYKANLLSGTTRCMALSANLPDLQLPGCSTVI